MISNFDRPASGFTLIELLVVMFIAALGLSLVGPRVFGAYEKIARSAEEQKLADIVAEASLKCFLRRTGYTLILEGATLKLKGFQTIVEFEHITFPPQTISFNGNGYSHTQEIIYHAGEKKRTLHPAWSGIRYGPG